MIGQIGLVEPTDHVDIVNVQEAKTHLSRLLARVEHGETIVLARGGRPIARLEPIAPQRRELGFVPYRLPASFFDPLTEDELVERKR